MALLCLLKDNETTLTNILIIIVNQFIKIRFFLDNSFFLDFARVYKMIVCYYDGSLRPKGPRYSLYHIGQLMH